MRLPRQERLLLQQSTVATGVFLPPYEFPSQPHPEVSASALRHAANLHRYLESPLHGPTVEAFDATVEWFDSVDPTGSRPLVLDSGCGTGRSTRLTALRRPEALVVGVDRSLSRLERGGRATDGDLPENALLVRAELASFWRLLLSAYEGRLAARVARHQLLYPNPYPKPSQRGKRWHCHPALPVALQLGGSLEVRSNWLPYLVEFREAVLSVAHGGSRVPAPLRAAAAAHLPARLEPVVLRDAEGADGLSLFEVKYHALNDGLYRLRLGVERERERAAVPVGGEVADRLVVTRNANGAVPGRLER